MSRHTNPPKMSYTKQAMPQDARTPPRLYAEHHSSTSVCGQWNAENEQKFIDSWFHVRISSKTSIDLVDEKKHLFWNYRIDYAWRAQPMKLHHIPQLAGISIEKNVQSQSLL